MGAEKIGSENELAWENRVLCSDESCIGIIGPNGRCKECGLIYDGELPAAWVQKSPPETDAGRAPNAAPDPSGPHSGAEEPAEGGASASTSDEEWERRRLCSDESCIGVIGPDGRCKECGLPYKG